nr:MAG TPA: hypothetical protein [Caudoviricetes sp.]
MYLLLFRYILGRWDLHLASNLVIHIERNS